MGKNKLSSGLINVVTYDTENNISLNSGSNLLMSLSGSGKVTIPGNLVVLGGISGSSAESSSYALNADKLDNLDSTQLVLTSSFNSYTSSASSSLGSLSGSVATTTLNLSSSVSSSIGSLSGSIATTTSELSSSIGSLSSSVAITTSGLSSSVATTTSNLSSSVATTTSGLAGRIGTIEGNYATTGSNIFVGSQVITGSLYITTDLIVQGSSSLQNITASAVSIGTNTVILNTDTPAVRFAGVSVQDSGSNAGVTGSIYWDGLCNRWIYSNPSNVGYSGGMILSGPRNLTTIGNESTLTCNYLAKSGGGDHLYDSCIYELSGSVGINTNNPGGPFDVKTSACSNILFTGDYADVSAINSYSTTNGFQTLKYAAGIHTFYAGAMGSGARSEAMRINSCGTTIVGYSKAGTSDSLQRTMILGGRPDSPQTVSLGFDSGCAYRADFDFDGNSGKFGFYNYNAGWSATPRLSIDINGITCFSSRICAPALTTCNLRVSDETTFGLRICTGPSVYPIIIADGGQSMGFYTCESGGSFAERMKISQTGIITIGCQVCLGNGSSSPVNPNKGIYLSNNGTTALIIRDSTNCTEFTTQVQSSGTILGTLTNHDLIIYTCNAERGRICANGKTRFLACGYGSYIFGNPNVSDDGTFIIGSVVGGTPLSLTDGYNAHTYFRFCSGQSVIESDGTMKFMTAGSINSLILAGTTGIACFSTTNAMIPPVGTTAERPTASTGMMRYNSTFNLMEFYNGTSWVQMGSGDLATAQCINNTSMCHSVYQVAGTTGLQGQGSGCISLYGAGAPSMATSNSGFQFATHGGHCGISDYPGYWAVHLGGARAVNQLKAWIHSNSWGYFELQGSNNSGNASGFNQSGNWTTLSFLCSTNNNCQNMGGNASGCSDGVVFTYWYTNNVPFSAYRIKVLDSSRPNQAIGSIYGGSAGYVWQLNRV